VKNIERRNLFYGSETTTSRTSALRVYRKHELEYRVFEYLFLSTSDYDISIINEE